MGHKRPSCLPEISKPDVGENIIEAGPGRLVGHPFQLDAIQGLPPSNRVEKCNLEVETFRGRFPVAVLNGGLDGDSNRDWTVRTTAQD
jgi:hypothetical protein